MTMNPTQGNKEINREKSYILIEKFLFWISYDLGKKKTFQIYIRNTDKKAEINFTCQKIGNAWDKAQRFGVCSLHVRACSSFLGTT